MNRQAKQRLYAQLAALALSCMAATASAAPEAVLSTLATESIGICTRLPDRLNAQDTYWVQSRLDEAFPKRQAALFQKIRIEEDPSDELLGPQFRDNGSGILTLRLPQRYLKRLCHQILLQTVHSGKFDTLSDMNAQQLKQMDADAINIGQRTGACRAELRNEPKCLDREILAYLRQSGVIHEGDKIDSEDESLIVLAYGAAEFFIAHEAYHAIVRLTMNDSQQASLTQEATETEADLYALQHLFGQQNLPLAPMMAMATTSLIDRGPVGAGSHPADTCRYQKMRAVFARSAPTLFKIAGFMTKEELFDNDAEAADFVKEALQYPFMRRTSGLSGCGSDANPSVDAAISDLNKYFDPIFGRLRSLDIEDFNDFEDADLGIDNAEFEKIITSLESRQWKSQIGRKIATTYVYFIAIGMESSANRTNSIQDAMENDRVSEGVRLSASLGTNLMRVYQRLGPEWFSNDIRVLLDTGIELLAVLKENPNITSAANAKRIRQGYNNSIDLVLSRNDFDLFNFFKTRIYFEQLSPSLSGIYFPRFGPLKNMVETYTENEVAFGNCSDPKFLASTLMNRISSQVQGAERLDRAACQNIKAEHSVD